MKFLKKGVVIYFLLTILFFVHEITFAKAVGKNNNSLFTEQDLKYITEHVGKYLSTTSLRPYVSGKGWKYQALGLENIDIPNNNFIGQVLIGEISKGKKRYSIAFLPYANKTTNQKYMEFLYIADEPISARLYADILPLAESIAIINTSLPVKRYIKNKNYNPKIGGPIEWIFFEEKVIKKLTINLKPDGQGGTYFTMSITAPAA